MPYFLTKIICHYKVTNWKDIKKGLNGYHSKFL